MKRCLKWLSFALTLTAVLFCTAAMAEIVDSGEFNNITWTLNDSGLLELSGTGEISFFSSSVPWADYYSSINEVIIDNGVTSIGFNAFSDCSSLTSITIPNGVTSIGYGAFSGCSSLTSITIPESVASIGNYAFDDCSSLTSITIPDDVASIGDSAFYNCSSLTSITIPEGVIIISYRAFSGCSSLTNVTIPEGVTSIGDCAFYNCSSLTSITIPDGVTRIGDSAFYNCSAVRYANLGSNGAKSLSLAGYTFRVPGTSYNLRYLFSDAEIEGLELTDAESDITEITIPEGVTSIRNDAFNNCSRLTSITIPDGVTSIGDSAFCDCSSLTSITIPDGVTSIGEWAFYGCSSLTSITIPDDVTSISDSAFSGCSSLTSITIPDDVTSIGDSAFYDCSSLTGITIPDGVTSIGRGAFCNCSRLTSITIPEGVTNISSIAFSGCSLKKVQISSMDINIDLDAFELFDDGYPVFYCYKMSDAEVYADTRGFPKVLLDGVEPGEYTSIEMPEKLTIVFSGTTQLPIIIFPDLPGQNVILTSSNENVVTVDENGTLTPVSTGTAKITATVRGVSAQTLVTVAPRIRSFNIPDTVYVLKKRTADVPISFTPASALVFLSYEIGDTSIASVDERGVLNGIELGTTTLTVSDSVSGTSKTVDVCTCYPVSAISFEKSSVTLAEGLSAQLTANVTMRDQSCVNQLVTFSSNNTGVATVDSVYGTVTGVSKGTATITARSANGKTATCTVTVHTPNKLTLPAGLKAVPAEAFTATNADQYIIPSGVTSIGSKAFASLKIKGAMIKIPASVTTIPDDAFSGSDVVIWTTAGSPAAAWAEEHDVKWVK